MKKKLIKTIFWLLILVIIVYNPLSVRVYVLFAAIMFDLDTKLFYNQIKMESSFKSLAYSRVKAIGPGQIRVNTGKYISPEIHSVFLWVPFVNVYISAKYMRYLLDKYNGNYSLALVAYNWGETNVDKKIKGIKIEKNKNYIYKFKNIPESYGYLKKIMNKK